MIPELAGGWPIPEELDFADGKDDGNDAEGNQCSQDKVCGPDNLRYVDAIRTLFIGEDTSRRNNNFIWAFNIDTRRLSRVLSMPMNAEATGLTLVPDYSGFRTTAHHHRRKRDPAVDAGVVVELVQRCPRGP